MVVGGGGWLRVNLVIALAELEPSLGQADQLKRTYCIDEAWAMYLNPLS